MTIRNLDATMNPRSVALIGASDREGSVGRVVIENVVRGGYAGAIYPINPKHRELQGRRCYARVADLPEAPDLAVIMTPPQTVPDLIAELGAKGARAAVVLTAGLNTDNGLRQKMLDAARPSLLRIVGPNTIGLLAPHVALNASFVHIAPKPGRLGLISQSGAIVSSIVDWAAAEGIGFSQIYSLGDMSDVDVGDCLNMLAGDEHTSAILMYLESITSARKFMSAARAAARVKPVIAVKPGRHEAAAKAALTHTGSLAGADRVVEAALRRAGIIRVRDLDDLFNAAEITGRFAPLERGRVAIVTNGGGAGVLAVDQLIDEGAELATLAPATIARMDAALPATWSRSNPVDIIGDAPPARYRAAIEAVADDAGVDAILVMNCPTAIADPSAAAQGVVDVTRNGRANGKPVLTCWLGKLAAEPARSKLSGAGLGTFNTPAQAAEAVALLTRWSELRRRLERVPPSRPDLPVDTAAARAIMAAAAREGRSVLTEDEAKAVLGTYGIAIPQTLFAASEDDVEALATQLLADNSAVVVKMLSRTVSHKSDLGGVVLNLRTPDAARAAAAGIRARFTAALPDATLDGFTVQPMIRRPNAVELIAGLTTDPVFGPVIVFGRGGTAVEVIRDTATGLVPLDDVLAGDLIERTRVSRLLAGYRDKPAANREALSTALVALSQLAIDFPCIRSADINPLLADDAGVIALDARIEIDPARVDVAGPNPTLAIRPYPAGWEKQFDVDGQPITLRPLRPADAVLFDDFMGQMDREDLRLRFLVPTKGLSRATLIRLTQLDYDRDIAFIALGANGEMVGIVRYSADPDRIRAEYGVMVRSDLKGKGLGRVLMETLLAYARADGLRELFGIVLRENTSMLTLSAELGFAATTVPDEPALVRVVWSVDQSGQGES